MGLPIINTMMTLLLSVVVVPPHGADVTNARYSLLCDDDARSA